MKNLEQIRAANALGAAPNTTKQAVSKLPAMILSNGLLAAAAFAMESNNNGQAKRPEMKSVMDAAALHLAMPLLGLGVLNGCKTADSMVKNLSKDGSSCDVQRATTEALAFIGYVKRFATKEGEA